MKVFFAVFICKILYFIGSKVGKGSSLPGKVVLRVFPGVLKQLRLPETIIAVTGSNGKTTTVEMIVHALEVAGKKVGWNREGSNQTEGVATLLLRVASFSGKVKCDAIVMECDERYAKKIFEQVKPSALLVTNLCRDQLTRNGHPEFIEDCIRAAIDAAGSGVRFVLNADDPYVAALAYDRENRNDALAEERALIKIENDVLWFGVSGESSGAFNDDSDSKHHGMYDDGAFCPVCKARMSYSYRIAGHYGNYKCSGCGLSRVDPDVEVIYCEAGKLLFKNSTTGEGNDNSKMDVAFPSLTNAYNFCAAVASVMTAGIDIRDSVQALDGFKLKSGRVSPLNIGERSGLLLLSKHENSFAYDRSLSWAVEQQKPCTVIVLVNAISRKYYTSETSWLWDINFDLLADDCVKNIVLAGRYTNELAMRFFMSSVDPAKIGYVIDLSGLRKYIERETEGDVYVVTCFSDKIKLLKALE